MRTVNTYNQIQMKTIHFSKTWGRCVFGTVFVTVIMTFGLYFTMFAHPPTEDILANNRRSRNLAEASRNGLKEEDFYVYFDGDEPSVRQYSQAKWDLWIQVNGHVDIGDVYLETCGEFI